MKTIKNNIISAILITTLVAGVVTVPSLISGSTVDAAAKKVTIKYKANGGKFTAKKYSKKKTVAKKVRKNKKRGTAPKVSRTGYKLKGWYTKKSGGKKYTKNKKIKKKATLYARWSANTYTVTFNENNVAKTITNKQVRYDSKYSSVLYTPQRTGYIFGGWYTASGVKVAGTDKYKTASNITLYARWVVEVRNLEKFERLLEDMTTTKDEVLARYPGLKKNEEDSNNQYETYTSFDGREIWVFEASGNDNYIHYDAKVSDVFGDIPDCSIEEFGRDYVVHCDSTYQGSYYITYYCDYSNAQFSVFVDPGGTITRDTEISFVSSGRG